MPGNNPRLKELGERLKRLRLKRNEGQEMFAARIGASVPTLRKMENGDPQVAIGFWVAAMEILDKGEDIDKMLDTEDLFEKYEIQQEMLKKQKGRQRAGKRQGIQ